MKIIRNIVPGIKLRRVLSELKPCKKKIYEAREKGNKEEERTYIVQCATQWCKRVIQDFDIQIDLKGKENIPDTGPVVFAGNHQGFGDIVLCLYAFDKFQTGFLAKDNLARLPFYGKWIKDIRSVFIEREDTRASLKAINEGIELIEEGYSLVVFPEGTRSKNEIMAEFKRGSLRLATKLGVPIIPFTINNSYKIFEERGIVTKGVKVGFIIHPMILTEGLSREEIKVLDQKVEDIVRGGLK